jgi:hypothetical protein
MFMPKGEARADATFFNPMQCAAKKKQLWGDFLMEKIVFS